MAGRKAAYAGRCLTETGPPGPQGATGPQGPAGGFSCYQGFSPGILVINGQGGHTRIYTCIEGK